jgi:LPS O-antigen subunit length determinant protein (WzzB/FepE family)
MNNYVDKNSNDEIDFKELIFYLWRGKFFIVFVSFITLFLASLYLQSAERKYTVQYHLKPVGEIQNTPNLSGFGGIASIAGIQLPSSSNNDFNIFKKLISSVEVSEIIFNNKKIIKDIFGGEWNEDLDNFSSPPKSKLQTLIADIKKLLTGNKKINYIPPNARRLAMFISQNVQINTEKNTGYLSITSETSRPELILSLVIEAIEASDKIMRQRYIDFSTEPLAFYKEKLRIARSREHREALAELIGKEEQKLMFASRGKYFIAEPYINPVISLYPTSPNSKSILGFSLVFGLLIGSAIILFQSAIKKDN